MNQSNIFSRWLNYLEVPYSKYFSEKLFQEHPHKYTLYGISNLLSSYGIENVCVELKDKESIFDLSTPFLARLSDDFVIVKSVDRERVLYDWYGEDITMSVEAFMNDWSGVVLLAYPDEISIEQNYKKHIKEELMRKGKCIYIIMSCFVLYASAFLIRGYEDFPVLLLSIIGTVTNAGGFYVSYLLLLKQLHIQSSIADRICNTIKRSSCNDVLESKASKLFGMFGWSEIGMAYFAVNLCAIALTSQVFHCLLLLSVCSLVYVFWSLWYQRFKAHSWCPLCLIVQAVFVIQVAGYAVAYIFTNKMIEFTGLDFVLLFVGYTLVLFTLNKLLSTFVSAQKAQQLKTIKKVVLRGAKTLSVHEMKELHGGSAVIPPVESSGCYLRCKDKIILSEELEGCSICLASGTEMYCKASGSAEYILRYTCKSGVEV